MRSLKELMNAGKEVAFGFLIFPAYIADYLLKAAGDTKTPLKVDILAFSFWIIRLLLLMLLAIFSLKLLLFQKLLK